MAAMSKKYTVLAIIACLLWASPFVAAKFAMEEVPPLTLAAWRFLLAGLIQLPFCRMKGLHVCFRHWKNVCLVGFLNTFLLYTFFFSGLSLAPAALSAIVVGSSPLTAMLAAHFLMKGDRISLRKLQAVFMGMTGLAVLVLSTKPWEPVALVAVGGLGLLLIASFSSALGNVAVAKLPKTIPSLELNALQMLFGGGLLMGLALLFEGRVPLPSTPVFYCCLVWLSLVSALGFGIWFHLLGHVRVSDLNIWKFLIPVFGASASWLILPDESPTAGAVIGLVLVALALLHANRRKPARILKDVISSL